MQHSDSANPSTWDQYMRHLDSSLHPFAKMKIMHRLVPSFTTQHMIDFIDQLDLGVVLLNEEFFTLVYPKTEAEFIQLTQLVSAIESNHEFPS